MASPFSRFFCYTAEHPMLLNPSVLGWVSETPFGMWLNKQVGSQAGLWGKAAWLTVTEGEVVDYRAVESHIHDCELDCGWRVHEFCYDPYNATHFAKNCRRRNREPG